VSTNAIHKRVAIDTNVLIWGVRQEGPEKMKERAGWLFDQFEEDGVQVWVPAVCLAEYLIPVPPEKRAAVVAEISRKFHIQPLDAIAATFAAGLWEFGKKRIRKGLEYDRLIVKYDLIVVGCAKSAGVSALFTNDEDCRVLAEQVGIRGNDLPTMPNHLFPTSHIGASLSQIPAASVPSPKSVRIARPRKPSKR
jgi:predicted nucleic acid-binding protein